jgi:hypothetical protein
MGNTCKKFRMNMLGISWVLVLTDKHTYTHTHTHIHTYTHTHTHTHIHTYTHTHIHTYTHTHIHTYTHTRTHIHTYKPRWLHNLLAEVISYICYISRRGQLSLLPSAKVLFAIIFIIIISDEIFQLSYVIFIIQFLSRKYKMWIKFFRRSCTRCVPIFEIVEN